MRRIGVGAILSAALFLSTAPAGPARATDPVPAGYELVGREELGTGVVHTTLRRVSPPEQVVHVVRVAHDAPFRVRAVLSNEAVAGAEPRLERTTSMCQRVGCVAAVNADFAAVGLDEPVGAVVVDNELARTPVPSHHQFTAGDGRLAVGVAEVRTRLVPTDLREIDIDAVNRQRGADQTVLYTPQFGPSTATNPHGVELMLAEVGRLPTNETRTVRVVGLREGGDTPLTPGTAVLSGHGRAAEGLRDLWRRVQAGDVAAQAFLRADAAMRMENSVGGTPVLVREGRSWVAPSGDSFVSGRHPRTVVGWTTATDVLLVTVDGRQPGHSLGLTLPETADVMVALGAVEALNLDGGGSTTLAVGGAIANQPSDVLVRRRGSEVVVHSPAAGDAVLAHVERPVVSALAIVPVTSGSAGGRAAPPPSLPALPPSRVIQLAAADPGSNPDAGWPAAAVIVGQSGPGSALVSVALLLLLAVTAAVTMTTSRLRPTN